MERSFREIRLHRDKSPQEFLCHLIHKEKDYVVLRYLSPRPATIDDIQIEKGSTTIAHYWQTRNYVLWKFKDPDKGLKGYLFHICTNIEIGENYVKYEDLELDIWCDPDGNATILDQHEVNDSFKRGLISSEEISLIEDQKKEIVNNFQHILKCLWSEENTS